jgi:protein-arginine kinase activator protein McsA
MFRRRNLNDLFREFDLMFNQFDSVFGKTPKINKNLEEGSDEFGDWVKETYKSEDGSIYITNFIRTGSDTNRKSDKLNDLRYKLELAIESENFEEAVKLRDEIKSYESNKEKIEKLELELKKSIESQNFEKAIQLRDELKTMKS